MSQVIDCITCKRFFVIRSHAAAELHSLQFANVKELFEWHRRYGYFEAINVFLYCFRGGSAIDTRHPDQVCRPSAP